MRPDDDAFTVIILAAQRAGRVDPLAAEAGVTHKCLVPLLGAPLIRHVVAALVSLPGLADVRISVEPEVHEAVTAALAGLAAPVRLIPSADNLADSVYQASADVSGPLIITTADNVLLTPGAVRQMLAAIGEGADGAVALATRASVLAAHPEGQRNFYHFADDSYSNCNLYALQGPAAMRLVESFRTGGQFRRNPMRLITAFGLFTLLLLRFGRLSLASAAKRLSRRFRIDMRAIVLPDGSHAIDVDNPRSKGIAEGLLAKRMPKRAAG